MLNMEIQNRWTEFIGVTYQNTDEELLTEAEMSKRQLLHQSMPPTPRSMDGSSHSHESQRTLLSL